MIKSMKGLSLVFLTAFIFSCGNMEKNNNYSVHDSERIKREAELKMFNPNTIYYTKANDDGNHIKWTEKNYTVFKSNEFKNSKGQQFELVDIVGNNNYIIAFNEFAIFGDSIKHTILDTLINFSGFPDSVKHSTSVGVMDKDELIGLTLKGIPKESIISIVKDNTTIKEDIASAIKSHKEKNGNPFEIIDVKRNVTVLKAWFANMDTKKIELLELGK